MALVVKDRVKETTTTTGTGTYTLAGAVTGFEAFSSVGNSNTTYYACTDGTDFEVGIGTYTSSGTTLARTTILQSSNSDSAVSWSSGTKTIFCTQPAEKAVFLDASGNIIAANGSALTALNASNLASGTVANARLDQQLQDVAGLAVTNGNFIVGDGSNFVAESGATARTSLGLGTAAVLDTGISNTNIPKFTSGVADDDFLRVDGTAIEGRSAAEVLSDIGGQASLTFGISNTNAVKIDSTSVADDEYARFTANGLESRATSEVLSDIGAQASLTFGISNTNAVKIDSSSVADDEYARFTASGLESRSTSEVLSDIGGQASLTFGISNTNAVKIDSASVADDEFARFTANGLESRSASEVRSDIGLGTAAVAATGISNTNVPVFTSGVADNDFLRVDGTAIEGRSASEVLSDIAAMPLAGGSFTGDVTFTGDNYNIVFDKSDDALEFADNAELRIGDGTDLKIWHQSSSGNSFIQESGSGGLFIDASNLILRNSAGENLGRFLSDGAVELYYDNSKKLETVTSGVDITGYLRQSSVQAASVQLTTGNSQDSANPYTTTGVAIKWDLENYNSGCYSASTGRFTAPVDGVYEITVAIISSTSSFNFSVYHNDGSSDTDIGSGFANSSFNTGAVTAIRQMDAGDYMFVQLETGTIYIQSGTGAFNGASFKLLG